MGKIVAVFLLLITSLYSSMQQVELLADSVKKNGQLVIAKGNVLVYSKEYLISADKALYNSKSEILELFGNINMIRQNSEALKSNYVKLNFKNQEGSFKPFFTYEEKSKVWLECEQAKSSQRYYMTKNAIVSSCNVQNPDWKLGFKSGKLSKNSKFLYLKNVVFYIRDVPIFYLPYFAISTDTTRRTGLLVPVIGYDTTDGFKYKQPFYLANQVWWDLEIDPQIRLKRGVGIYSTFRFVDTNYSKGSVTIGGFRDNNNYFKQEKLKNDAHYGYEVEYENSRLLQSYFGKKADDGLRLDFTYLNDIDYVNLKDEDSQNDSLITSRLDYFLTSKKDYFGLYSRYYIDTRLLNNDATLQELPTLQYHRYLENIFIKNLLYSFDLKYHRYARKKGVGAWQIEGYLPLTFYTNYFNDYLHLEVSENMYASYVKYSNNDNKSDSLVRNFHKISLYSDLSRPYKNFYHSLKLGTDLIIPSWEKGEIEEDFIASDRKTKKLKTNLTQYFYNNKGQKKLKHELKQSFNFDNDSYRYGDLENEISYFVNDEFYVKNDLYYSFKNSRFSKIQTAMHYDDDKYLFDLIYTKAHEDKKEKRDFLIAKASANYGDYKFFTGLKYSFEDDFAKSWRIGYKYKRKCWNYTLIYKEDRSPKLTSLGTDTVSSKGVYLAFELYPLGGTEYDFSKERSLP